MVLLLPFLLLISYLTITPNQANLSSTMIDIYFKNLTLEWRNISKSKCETSQEETLTPWGPETSIYDRFGRIYTSTVPNGLNTSTVPNGLNTSTVPNGLNTSTVLNGSIQRPGTYFIGRDPNITADECKLSQPCQNQGTCHPNTSLPLKYSCQCLSNEYSGDKCENDNRICKNNTCWHNGTCIQRIISIDNKTKFECRCQPGYNGIHCELINNKCVNITCENRGICISSNSSWLCRCLDYSLYYGKYCEHKKGSLITKQILSKSFASIAIIAIIVVYLFVFIMDILKYGFKIDPVDRERQSIRSEQQKKQSNKNTKKKSKKLVSRVL